MSASYATIALLFPRNAADFYAGQQLTAFTRSVTATGVAHCLKNDDFPGPPAQLPEPRISTEFLDMAYIARTDSTTLLQSYPTPYDPRQEMSVHERKAYSAALVRCGQAVQRTLRVLSRDQLPQLLEQWAGILEQVDASAPVLAAGRQAQACSRGRGIAFVPINGRYEDGFFDKVLEEDTAAQLHHQNLRAQATDRAGARTFITCFKALEALRDRMRAQRRAQLFASNAFAIQQLQVNVTQAVRAMERRYGVKF